LKTIPFCCLEKPGRRALAESNNLVRISRAIQRVLAVAIRARDSSGRIAAADAIGDAIIVAAGRSAAVLEADVPALVSNAADPAARTVITAATPAHRGVHNLFLKC
jgi:hypothetical protein